jgi:guanylate kinase
MTTGSLFVLSGPSGTGKSTLCDRLLADFDNLAFSVSVTTRPIRGHEKHGEDYFFTTRDSFEEQIRAEAFIEWAEVHGNYYGTRISTVMERLTMGEHILLDIDVQGGLQLKQKLPEGNLIFIMPPSLEVLEKRLRARGTDSDKVIETRLENARREMEIGQKYDYIVVNDQLEVAMAELHKIVLSKTGNTKIKQN